MGHHKFHPSWLSGGYHRYPYVCLPCRKVAKGNGTVLCPHCGEEMVNAGDKFHAPKRSDDKAWSAVEYVLKTTPFGYGSKRRRDRNNPNPPLPSKENEIEDYERARARCRWCNAATAWGWGCPVHAQVRAKNVAEHGFDPYYRSGTRHRR